MVQQVRTDTRTRETTAKTMAVIERPKPGPGTPTWIKAEAIAVAPQPVPAASKMRQKIARTRDAVLKHFARGAHFGDRRTRARIAMIK